MGPFHDDQDGLIEDLRAEKPNKKKNQSNTRMVFLAQ